MLKQIEKNIYLRGAAQYQVKLMVAGRRISETFETLAEARTYRDKLRSDTALDHDKKQVLAQRLRKREVAGETLEKLLDRYVKEVSVLKKSENTDRLRVKKLKRHQIAQTSVYAITKENIQEFFAWLKEGGASDSSIRRYASLISHSLKTARRRWGMPIPNPVADMELPREGKPRRRRLESGEEERLVKELAKAENPLVLPAFQFSVETAMRRGELLGLLWRDVDLAASTATVHDTKNGESRTVPLSPRATEILVLLQKNNEKDEERVFPITVSRLREAWRAARSRAGVPDLRWHDMRREGASRLFEVHGLDIMEAAAVTGHKTLQVLKDHYTNLRAQKIADKMAGRG
jgi:integrase